MRSADTVYEYSTPVQVNGNNAAVTEENGVYSTYGFAQLVTPRGTVYRTARGKRGKDAVPFYRQGAGRGDGAVLLWGALS
jgi:hypothetical protein